MNIKVWRVSAELFRWVGSGSVGHPAPKWFRMVFNLGNLWAHIVRLGVEPRVERAIVQAIFIVVLFGHFNAISHIINATQCKAKLVCMYICICIINSEMSTMRPRCTAAPDRKLHFQCMCVCVCVNRENKMASRSGENGCRTLCASWKQHNWKQSPGAVVGPAFSLCQQLPHLLMEYSSVQLGSLCGLCRCEGIRAQGCPQS